MASYSYKSAANQRVNLIQENELCLKCVEYAEKNRLQETISVMHIMSTSADLIQIFSGCALCTMERSNAWWFVPIASNQGV
jgi:hypothetical protein